MFVACVHELGVKMQTLDFIDAPNLRTDIPDFRPGDTVRVNVKVI